MSRKNIFLKGMLMGACDIVPGISAGTIAFITGIYERLINAIKGFSPNLIWDFILIVFRKGDKEKFNADVKKLDLGFLIPLGLGIAFAILLFSRVISWLLESYFSFTMVFFVGLILASAKTIFDHIEKHHSVNIMFLFLGLILGISFTLVVPVVAEPSLWYIFLGGFLGISAMMLPGVSGSFILLVLGLYEFMLHALKNLVEEIDVVFVFILGAILGFMVISRVISLLFEKDKSKTLYLLLGLVVGSLGVPIRSIYLNLGAYSFEGYLFHVVLFVLGIIFASSITHFSKNKYLVKGR